MSTSPLSLHSLALLTGLIGLPAGAFAADPVYPPGSRFGFEPAKEMVVSRRFTGFERQSGGATVSVVELPAKLPQAAWDKLRETRISGKLIELSRDYGPKGRKPRD